MAHELGVAEIRSFLNTAKTSDSLEHKLYKVGSLIFAYGKEQRGLVLNPFDEIDRPKVAYTVPEILEQFKRLLETEEEEVPELIPFLAMAGFAGVRRSELVRECARGPGLEVGRWAKTIDHCTPRGCQTNFAKNGQSTVYSDGSRVASLAWSLSKKGGASRSPGR